MQFQACHALRYAAQVSGAISDYLRVVHLAHVSNALAFEWLYVFHLYAYSADGDPLVSFCCVLYVLFFAVS